MNGSSLRGSLVESSLALARRCDSGCAKVRFLQTEASLSGWSLSSFSQTHPTFLKLPCEPEDQPRERPAL